MARWVLLRILFAVFLLFSLLSPVWAEKPNFASEHYEAMRAATALDEPGKSAFHLKVEYQLYSTSGEADGQGSIEGWWAPGIGFHAEFESPSGSWKEPVLDSTYPPATREMGLAHDLLVEFVHPIHDLEATAKSQLDENSAKVGDATLNCLTIKPSSQKFCSEPNTNTLRMSVHGAERIVRNKTGMFHGSEAATEIAIGIGAHDAIRGELTLLQSVDLEATGFSQNKKALSISELQHLLSLPIHPSMIGQIGEILSGTATIAAVVGSDGSVRSTALVYASNPRIGQASESSVKGLRYKPLLWQGKPAEVLTTLTLEVTVNHKVMD